MSKEQSNLIYNIPKNAEIRTIRNTSLNKPKNHFQCVNMLENCDIQDNFSKINNLSQNFQLYQNQLRQQELEKDQLIQRLINKNKYLLNILKNLNANLAKKVQKQKFLIKKPNIRIKSESSTLKVVKHQQLYKKLDNTYRMISKYQQTIQILKKDNKVSFKQQDEYNQLKNKSTKLTQTIQQLQDEVKTQHKILTNQQKVLKTSDNNSITQMNQNLNLQIQKCKIRLKQIKKKLKQRQQLQKKQHLYLIEVNHLYKKFNQSQIQQSKVLIIKTNKNTIHQAQQNQIQINQWQKLKTQFDIQKTKYQQWNKKLSTLSIRQSKGCRQNEQYETKYKQKLKILQKLKSISNSIIKQPADERPQIKEKIKQKMNKLKDIINQRKSQQLNRSRRQHIINKINIQNFIEKERFFKKWQLSSLNIQQLNNHHQSSQY